MLKKIGILIILAVSFSFASGALKQAANEERIDFVANKLKEELAKTEEAKRSHVWRKHEGSPLPEYEKLVFNARWKFITVGEATLELRGFDDIEGRKAHHIYSYAKTKPFFDNFFKVRDVNESWLDEESKVSLRYSSNISEGGWKKLETLYFNHPERTFLLNDNGKMKKGAIPENLQDVLSALYYIRTMDIKAGDKYVADAHSGDLSWPLTISVLKEEKVSVPAGTFNCFVLEPAIRKNAGIVNASGKMRVWVTADEKKMPVLLKVKIPILGSVEAELERMAKQQNLDKEEADSKE
ncbi:MAG: DUF3108 domain-containing protein [Endomicrobia bacterium]|nr:DUF3108 domain-containing protein [Endomicrobiia bacterium]